MTQIGQFKLRDTEFVTEISGRQYPDASIVNELIAVLRPHPRGLRRWSVMRAIRNNRNRLSQNIPQKFEEQIERTFRRFCADTAEAESRACPADVAPFYRPRDTAGEVWAFYPERLAALFGGAPANNA